MERHPMVFLQSVPTGRRAKLVGGPDVAEVIEPFHVVGGQGDDRIAGVVADVGISERAVRDAVRYYSEYPEEIDAEIALQQHAFEEGYAAHLRAKRLTG